MKVRKTPRKILSLFLTLAMIAGLFTFMPMIASADVTPRTGSVPLRLHMDPNDTTQYPTLGNLLGNSTTRWTRHAASGWYYAASNANNGSSGVLRLIEGEGVMTGSKVIEFNSTDTAWARAYNLDLDTPIEWNTGEYGITFDYRIGQAAAQEFTFGFSGRSHNGRSPAAADDGVAVNRHLRMFDDTLRNNSTGTGSETLVLGSMTRGTWYRVYGLIDTAATGSSLAEAVRWHAVPITATTGASAPMTFEAFAEDSALGVKGPLSWNTEGVINSLIFSGAANSSSRFLQLANISLFEYPEFCFFCEECGCEFCFEDGECGLCPCADCFPPAGQEHEVADDDCTVCILCGMFNGNHIPKTTNCTECTRCTFDLSTLPDYEECEKCGCEECFVDGMCMACQNCDPNYGRGTPVRLDVDLNEEPYDALSLPNTMIAPASDRWTEGVGGWYIAGEAAASHANSVLRVLEDASAPGGVALEMSFERASSSTCSRYHVELEEPILRNSGQYAFSTYVNTQQMPQSARVTVHLSDTTIDGKSEGDADQGTAAFSSAAANNTFFEWQSSSHHTTSRIRVPGQGDGWTAWSRNANTWKRVQAVIDTNENFIYILTTDSGDEPGNWDELFRGKGPADSSYARIPLVWGPGNKITSVGFSGTTSGSAGNPPSDTTINRVRIADLSIHEFDPLPDLSMLEWTVFPADENVSFMGTTGNSGAGHVMKLESLEFDEFNLPTRGANLIIDYRVAHNTGRRILAWTDLSGEKPDIEDITFATTDNIADKKVIVSGLMASGATGAELRIPQELLYDKETDTYATEIYAIMTIDKGPTGDMAAGDNYTTANGNRGGSSRNGVNSIDLEKEFDIIDTVKLDVLSPLVFNTFITLTPGANESEINFAWFTPIEEHTSSTITITFDPTGGNWAGSAENKTVEKEVFLSHLQLIPASDLEDGDWPDENPAGMRAFSEFAGTEADETAYGFRTNKIVVRDLIPGEYAYRLGDGTEGHWSPAYTFEVKNPNEAYNVIVFGDPQLSNSSAHEGKWRDGLTRSIAQANTMGGAAFLMTAGDNTGYANDYLEMARYLEQPQLRSYPMMVTIGNHDTQSQRTLTHGSGPEGSNNEHPLALLSMVYNWPNHKWLEFTPGGSNTSVVSGPRSESDSLRGGGNWYMSYGDVQYISLNTNLRIDAQHDRFLEEAVAAHPDATWRIAISHFDPFGIGNGHSLGLAAMRDWWASVYEKHGIDLVINGHDHNYGRSQFIQGAGTSGWEIAKYQHPSVVDIDELNIFKAKPPGAYVDPIGTQFISMGSVADWPKYNPASLEERPWAAHIPGAPGSSQGAGEYGILTIDGDTLTFTNYKMATGSNPDIVLDSITLKKTADFDDLETLISGTKDKDGNKVLSGMEDVSSDDIEVASWSAFQAEIASAKAITSTASADVIHEAYMDLYDAFYALVSTADKDDLEELIADVKETLATTTEGRWENQHAPGSKAILKVILDEAIYVFELRITQQDVVDAVFAKLETGLAAYMATAVGKPPCPWIYVHEITADAPYTITAVDWMKETDPYYIEAEMGNKPMYFEHFTKAPYSHQGAYERTESRFAPATLEGGRGVNETYVTGTRIGEWIRYELDVEQAGEYKASLGAVNAIASVQRVLLRDTNQNILTEFSIPASYGDGVTFAATETSLLPAPIAGDETFYLPAGEVIIEMFFINNGVPYNGGNVGAPPAGAAFGPDVDIIILERIGNMTAPVIDADPNRWDLPFFPTMINSSSHRQRGWQTDGETSGNTTIPPATGLPIEIYSRTEKIIIEVAANFTTTTSTMQLHIENDGGGAWLPEWAPGLNSVYDPSIGPNGALVLDFSKIPAPMNIHVPTVAKSVDWGRFDISYYSSNWEDLNYMRAYLILADEASDASIASDFASFRSSSIVAFSDGLPSSGGVLLAGGDIPADPTKDDHNFGGWFTAAEDGTAVDLTTARFKTDTTVYAQWLEEGSYNVTFNFNYDGSPANITKATGTNGKLAAGNIPAVPEREGFIFKGWFTAPMLGTEIDPAAFTFEENTFLYAQWMLEGEDCICVCPPGTEKIWELDITPALEDLNTNDGNVGGLVRAWGSAGRPQYTVTDGKLVVSGRTNDWHSVDVDLRDFDLEPGVEYKLTVTGTAPGPFVLEFPLDSDPWSTGRVIGTNTGASITFDSVMPSVGSVSQTENGHRIRVRADGISGTGSYTIESIIIEKITGAGGHLPECECECPKCKPATKPGKPTASANGSSTSASRNITLTAPGAAIYYTVNGGEPTTSSTLYTTPIALNFPKVGDSHTIRAIAVINGVASDVAVFTYTRSSGGGGGPSGPSTPSDPTTPTTSAPVVAQPGAPLTLPANFTIPATTVAALRGDALLPAATIRATAAGNQTVNFGTTADVAGQNAILVRIGADGELEVVSAVTIGANGQATVNVPGAGDYLVLARKTGDITGTGEVQTQDALALLRHIAGIAPLNALELFVANGKIGDTGTTDALNILRYIAGIIDKI
ncbi:MAG: InlB B-repeat-containing protein [Oscillospiraceae bacterium]|nr:InlB B-repeat-containing protein [Oscillospiraceae bacterium]